MSQPFEPVGVEFITGSISAQGLAEISEFIIEEDHPLVSALVHAARTQTRRRPKVGYWNFSTEGTYTAGIAGMRRPLNSAHDASSKCAVVMLTKQGAIEWAEFGIRVNAVAPHGCLTDMVRSFLDTPEKMAMATSQVPMRRLNEPHEVASAAVFLCSDAASMITAHVLPVDGGILSAVI